MPAIRLRPPNRNLPGALAILLSMSLPGCLGSSSTVEGELSDAARQRIIQRKVDVRDRSPKGGSPRAKLKGS